MSHLEIRRGINSHFLHKQETHSLLQKFCGRNYNKYLYLDQTCKHHNLTISSLWWIRFEFWLWTNQRTHVRIVAEMLQNVGGDSGAVTETAENGCGDSGKQQRKRQRWKHMSFCLMIQDLMPKYPHTEALKACERLKTFGKEESISPSPATEKPPKLSEPPSHNTSTSTISFTLRQRNRWI